MSELPKKSENKKKCENCGNNLPNQKHICPYDEDVNGIIKYCNCCDDGRYIGEAKCMLKNL